MQNSVLGLPISHATIGQNPFSWRYKAINNNGFATPFEWKQSAKDSDFVAPNIKKEIDGGSELLYSKITFRSESLLVYYTACIARIICKNISCLFECSDIN